MTRLYLFYMLVVSLSVFAFSQIISGGEILLLEITYTLLATAIILFVLMFSTYWMVGVMHGRLGFQNSMRSAVLIAIGTGLISLLGALSLNFLNGDTIPFLYAIFVAAVVPAMQFGGVKVHGVTFADWVDQIIGLKPHARIDK